MYIGSNPWKRYLFKRNNVCKNICTEEDDGGEYTHAASCQVGRDGEENSLERVRLKGLCHQIRKAWKWYSFKGLGMDMRRLIFVIFENLPLIFNRHFKFLCWGSKSVQIFYFFLTLFEAALNVLKLLSLCSEIILTLNAFFWLAIGFPAFSSIIALFASWKFLELLFIGFEPKWRRIVSSTSVQDLHRAPPATFRTQIEQIRTHFEQPQKRFKTKWKIWTLFEPQLKKFKCLLKIREQFQKNLSIRRLMS